MAAYDDIDFTPPAGVRAEAKKGLDWRKEYNRGGTAVGVARARDLSNGVKISPDTARRMASYFARHEVDKHGEGFSPGEPGFPSAGRIAWALWGGDPGQAWANKLTRQMDAADNRSTTMKLERRDVPLPLAVETRESGTPVIRGMAARYNVRSVDLGGFTEEIRPGAFDAVMKAENRNVVALYNHDSNYVLGTERAGTLRLAATADGLAYEIDPPASREDVLELIRRSDLFGSSFAFTVARDGDEWTTDENGKHLRFIRAIDGLYDVGPVLTPAYSDTSVAVRSLEKHLQTHRPALKLPALRRDAKTEKAIRRFLRQHGRKVG